MTNPGDWYCDLTHEACGDVILDAALEDESPSQLNDPIRSGSRDLADVRG
jgi:hypothetical protein